MTNRLQQIKIQEAKKYIEKQTVVRPEIGLNLGSGLGVLADEKCSSMQLTFDSKFHHLPPYSSVVNARGAFLSISTF
ncbi:hypothetical protein GCM10011571_17340 [Marinithermofilum abyssi]|uniref:Uncharacterized protein n=1 Tax=Marinithermofilum abyssi TaxID=1571185 RepID=A0A8J2VGF2_9BACL|nr:hypothetical protein [Marinithermofilum abyssi]GGE16208.1 hypothetical protein GCM10011571_17340 [Marinithermofilum abyssi]